MIKFRYFCIQLILLCSIFRGVSGEDNFKMDIFIKSYSKDFSWLSYCVRSIEKFVKNVNNVIIVIPEKDLHLFNLTLSPKFQLHVVNESGNGYLFQQYIKMTAHHYSQADYIMFVDSDCVFTKEIDFHELVKNEKPTILMTKYSELVDKNGKSLVPWQSPTEKVFGQSVKYEFMRRNFLVYKSSTLEHLEKWFPHDLKNYILSQTIFSEFNVIGAFAYFFENNNYNFIDTKNWTYEEPPGKQFWSYSGLTEIEKQELESLLQ